jgi:hypothetical protein
MATPTERTQRADVDLRDDDDLRDRRTDDDLRDRRTDDDLRDRRNDDDLRGGRDLGTQASEPRRRNHRFPETKTFIGTSEFWMTVGAVGALAAIYYWAEDASFDLWSACLLGTIAVVAYVISRGLAKAGSQRDIRREDRSIDRF